MIGKRGMLPDKDSYDDDFPDFPDFNDQELVDLTEDVEMTHQRQTSEQMVQQDLSQHGIPPAPLSPDTDSFHKFENETLRTWIFPTNHQTRNYQLAMIEKGLFENTLITLPTGMGKTFIAAVIMYNFWRWFPESKVVFLAPAHSLVAQQIEACSNICGFPPSETIELTSQMTVLSRAKLWESKRVFFLSPQTMQMDLISKVCPEKKVVCLVVDEAHQATGNYAISEVIRTLSHFQTHFRILALTATPITIANDLQGVVNNLHINSIHIRTEDSVDLEKYTYSNQIQNIVPWLSPIDNDIYYNAVNTFHQNCFQPLLKKLVDLHALKTDDPDKNSPFGLTMSRTRFCNNVRNISDSTRNEIISTFSACEELSRASEVLHSHGIPNFVDLIERVIERAKNQHGAIATHPDLQQLITSLKQEMENPRFMGHPKMNQLVKLVLDHFARAENYSKVVIFASSEKIAEEIYRALKTHRPVIHCSKSVNDEFNTLICTCFGNEELYAIQFDLIICYDSSPPLKMLQNMEKAGHTLKHGCIALLTRAEEKQNKLKKAAFARVEEMIVSQDINPYQSEHVVFPVDFHPSMSVQSINENTDDEFDPFWDDAFDSALLEKWKHT